jgi:pimeloyl-ACP methyl ester carboxylesterase
MSDVGNRESLIFFRQLGEGCPLVLVHGLMVTGEMFESVMGTFAKRHRVIVPDLRGHGRSACLPGSYNVDKLAADLAELLDGLRSSWKLRQPLWVTEVHDTLGQRKFSLRKIRH